jgi:two-component system, LytTR family, response regulator
MNETYSCIIVDDEPLAIARLEKHLGDVFPNVNIIATYTSWSRALQELTISQSDILFLDISMQGKNGMDLVKMIPNLQSEVVFVTAHSEYALEAFQLFAAAYILKPFDKVELTRVITKIIKRVSDRRIAEGRTNVSAPAKTVNKIAVPSTNTINYVDVDDILYLEAAQGYTRIITRNESLLCTYSIGVLAELLVNHPFHQVHRSYVVNLNHVSRYETDGTLIMTGGKEVPVSKNERKEFMNMFLKINK